MVALAVPEIPSVPVTVLVPVKVIPARVLETLRTPALLLTTGPAVLNPLTVSALAVTISVLVFTVRTAAEDASKTCSLVALAVPEIPSVPVTVLVPIKVNPARVLETLKTPPLLLTTGPPALKLLTVSSLTVTVSVLVLTVRTASEDASRTCSLVALAVPEIPRVPVTVLVPVKVIPARVLETLRTPALLLTTGPAVLKLLTVRALAVTTSTVVSTPRTMALPASRT